MGPIGTGVITLGTRFLIRFAHSGMWHLSIKDTPHQFYLHLTPLSDNNSCVLIWVSCSLPANQAGNYRFTVNVGLWQKQSPCVSCDILPSDVKKEGKGLLWNNKISRNALVSIQPVDWLRLVNRRLNFCNF